MYAKYSRPEPIERAVKFVMSRQLPVRSQILHDVVFSLQLAHALPFFVGWFMGARGDRGDVQSDGRDLLPELQILVHHLDVGQG